MIISSGIKKDISKRVNEILNNAKDAISIKISLEVSEEALAAVKYDVIELMKPKQDSKYVGVPEEKKELEPEKQDPPKKEWNEKQKKDIQMIKDAHKAKRAQMDRDTTEKPRKANRRRSDLDDGVILDMFENQKMKPKQIAKKLGCCEQTVRNRIEVAKRDRKK